MCRYNGFRVRGWTVKFNTFDLQALSRALGVPSRKLLVWREERHLPGNWTNGRFDAREVMELAATYYLGDHATSKLADMRMLCRAAQHMIWHAIVYENGACEAHGTLPDVRDCLRQIKADQGAACDLTALQAGRRYLVGQDGGNEETPSARFHSNLDEVELGSGPIIDLQANASRIRRRLRQPLLDLDVDFRTHGPLVRRLSRASARAEPQRGVTTPLAYQLCG